MTLSFPTRRSSDLACGSCGPSRGWQSRRDAGERASAPLPGAALRHWRRGSSRHSPPNRQGHIGRSEEHTSELQSLLRISYAVFCLKKTHVIVTSRTQPPSKTHTSIRKKKSVQI